MRFKPGDIVIKHTGGNRMTIFESINENHECIWVTDKVNQDTFSEEDLLTMDEYIRLEEREEKINNILK